MESMKANPLSGFFVFFQENGFSFRETSILAANKRWGLSFADDPEPGRSYQL
jgi:hypothetical protein